METFTMDKSFYDIGAGDLKELWDSDLDPTMQEVFRSGDTTDISSAEWGGIMSSSSSSGIVGLLRSGSGIDKSAHGVVLHDRLMTETVLGSGSATLMPPIKSEHSYSLASDGDSPPDSPISHGRIHHQQDNEVFSDMEDECFPAIPLTQAGGGGGRCSSSSIDVTVDVVNVKDEPLTDPDSPSSSCPASPSQLNDYDFELSPTMMGTSKNVLKHNVLLSSRSNIFTTQHRTVVPKVNIKVEPGTSGFSLPPTPPSCTSSDDSSEDNAPATTCAQTTTSVNTRSQRTSSAARLLISAPIATRQPIHTPLISSQPKGSTGQLILTEEEKRTLLAEGYPVPTRLPLTKAEEKSLKKIRRKIKNKISAQESRRKKKEYMDQLERRVEILVSENTDYRKKIESLEDSNSNLLSQLAKLQAIVARTHPQTLSRHK